VAEEGETCSSVHLLLIIFVLVLAPSVRPLWKGRVSAAVAAWMSRSSPRVKARTWGRSAVRADVIHSCSRVALPRVRGEEGREVADEAGRARISGQAASIRARVSAWLLVRRSGLVGRSRVARRGDRCGRLPSSRPWLM
jgi:hypothetical protein